MAAASAANTNTNTTEPPTAFDAAQHWDFVGVTFVFGARGVGKSTLASSLVAASGASTVVLLGGYGASYERAHEKVVAVDTWDAAQQAMQAARDAGGDGVLLVVDAFHSDEPVDRQPWLRALMLNCRTQTPRAGVVFVYDSPFFLGRLLPVARACAGHVFAGRTIAADEGRRMNALLATVNGELNEQTKQLLEFVSRSEHLFLHVNTDSIQPETRFHLVQGELA